MYPDADFQKQKKKKKSSQDASVRLRVGLFAFCLKDGGWSRAALAWRKNHPEWNAAAYAILGRLGDGNGLL